MHWKFHNLDKNLTYHWCLCRTIFMKMINQLEMIGAKLKSKYLREIYNKNELNEKSWNKWNSTDWFKWKWWIFYWKLYAWIEQFDGIQFERISLSLTIKITPLLYVLRFMCHQNENFTVFISVLLSKSSIPAQLKTKICNYIICSSMKCYRLYQITCWTKSEGNPDILALVEQNQTVGPAKAINFKKCDCIWTNEFVSTAHKVEHL